MTTLAQSYITPLFSAPHGGVMAQVSRMIDVAAQRRALAKLDATQLKDLGLSAQDAHI